MKKCLLLLAASLGLVLQLRADIVQGTCGDGVIYIYDSDNRKMIISGNGPMYDYDQYNVGPFYPLSHHMKILVIEHGVTHIGNRAFWGCYSLTGRISLPMSVTSIGDEAFYACNYLSSLELSPSIVTIGDNAFASCSGMEGNLVLPDCLESIGDGSFSGCKKFSGDLLIPNSVKSIGRNAFAGCEGFNGKLVLGSSLENIGEYAFSGGTNFIGELSIPSSVTKIGRYAFDGNKGFVGSIVVPEGVTEIEDGVFRSCSGITSVTLLGQVTRLGNSAFHHCSALTEIVCYSTTPPDAVSFHVFDNTALKTIYVPSQSLDLYKSTAVWENYEILPIEGNGIDKHDYDDQTSVVFQDGILKISVGEGCLRGAAIMSMSGGEVLSCETKTSAMALNVSSIPSGVYLIVVDVDGTQHNYKVRW